MSANLTLQAVLSLLPVSVMRLGWVRLEAGKGSLWIFSFPPLERILNLEVILICLSFLLALTQYLVHLGFVVFLLLIFAPLHSVNWHFGLLRSGWRAGDEVVTC